MEIIIITSTNTPAPIIGSEEQLSPAPLLDDGSDEGLVAFADWDSWGWPSW